MTSLSQIQKAQECIAPYILKTPLLRCPALDAAMGCVVYLKLESVQLTGSFKIRGALNKILALSDAEKARGVVCSSSGNHAQGVAYASALLGINAKIVLPSDCNPTKVKKIKDYGGEIVFADKLVREKVASEIASDEKRVLVHAFADPFVKAGQGTVGLELLQDEPALDAVVVPVGGGGLISGVATAVKESKPGIRVYGIEHKNVMRYTNCRNLGRVADITGIEPTIADAVMGTHACAESFETINRYADALLLTDDVEIKSALYNLVAYGHVVAEPTSCMTLAAAMSGKIPFARSEKVAFVLSGGNNDLKVLTCIIEEVTQRTTENTQRTTEINS